MIRFNLHKRNDTQSNLFSIKAIVTINKKRITFDTGIKISAEHWNVSKQIVKKSNANAVTYNLLLNDIKTKLIDAYNIAILNNANISINEIKKQMQNAIKPENVNHNFITLIEKVINAKHIKSASIQNYNSFYLHIKKFATNNNIDVDLYNINNEFASNFINYLISLNLSAGYINLMITIFKAVVNYANEIDLHIPVKLNAIKLLKNRNQIISLNINEVKKFLEVKVNNTMQVYKDMFIFQLFTSLRYSDLMNIKNANINIVEGTIKVNSVKTDVNLSIPILANISEIVNKYYSIEREFLFDKKSLVIYNANIKLICKLAGINDNIVISKYIGINRIDSIVPKYEFISSHTARRSFATISKALGIDNFYIQQFTGHKDITMLANYISVNDNDLRNEYEKFNF